MRRRAWLWILGCCALLPTQLAAEPAGYSARATIAIEATTQKGTLSLGGDAAFEQRGRLYRLDLRSLDVTAGSTKPQILPQGGYTVVYDAGSSTYTVWSVARRAYFSGKGKPAVPSPSPTPTPSASAEATATPVSPLARLKDLRAFSLSIDLAPAKETVDNHTTTAFDFKLTEQRTAGDPFALNGHVNFADDLSGIPILLVAHATYGSAIHVANLRFALTHVQQSAPPESDFSPPADYSKAANLFDVLVLPPGLGGR